MKAVVFHGVGDIRLDDVPEPQIQEPTDAIVRVTASAICGTDLHMIRGTQAEMKPGTILGHEGVGIVEQTGPEVQHIKVGDRVVATSTIACGQCDYCKQGRYALCDRANPKGPQAGISLFGGTESNGSFNGLQAEKARIPFADTVLVKLPDEISDDQAILLSDILPTAYFGAELAQIQQGNVVAVFGCGPVGQFIITCAQLMGAGRIFAVDTIPSRLEMARAQGAEVIDFNVDNPVTTIQKLTGGIGADRVIDAVGVDANSAHRGHAKKLSTPLKPMFKQELEQIAPETNPQGDNWHPGDAPTQALIWEIGALAKAGTLAVIGVYPKTVQDFPIGAAMNRNISVTTGHCNHRKYIPLLIDLLRARAIDPTSVLTQVEQLTSAIEAYKAFDEREPGWVKVKLEPAYISS